MNYSTAHLQRLNEKFLHGSFVRMQRIKQWFQVCCEFVIILLAVSVTPAFSAVLASDTYCPLEIGNEWSYKTVYDENERKESVSSQVFIARNINKQNGSIEFMGEDNAVLFYKTSEGIMSSSGFLILKNSLSLGTQWESGTHNYDQRHNRVEAVGIEIAIGKTKYKNCIRILTKSDEHALAYGAQSEHLVFESKITYCPQIGPVLIENFEVSRSGKRKLVSQSELVSFRKEQSLKGNYKQTPVLPAISINDSFRFPEKNLRHPSLSPDDKWIVYRKRSMFSDMHGLQSLDTTYKKMYYSAVGENKEIPIPLPKAPVDKVGYYIEWSQNGKILALSAEIDQKDSVMLLDFSGFKPNFMESFEAEDKSFHWTLDNALLYIDASGNLMKKYSGKDAEKVVTLGKGRSVYEFQAAENGALLYSTKDVTWRVYKTSIRNSGQRNPLFEDEMMPVMLISPDGQFTLISTRDREKPDDWKTILYDLRTDTAIMKVPAEVQNAHFSPDGTKLAYKETAIHRHYPSPAKYSNPHFFILDLKTKQLRDYGFGINEYFNWTPDGGHIIYSSKCTHESVGIYEDGIYIIKVSDGAEIARLTFVNANHGPTISRSGKYVIWEGADMNTFFVIQNPLNTNIFQAVK